MTGAVVRLGWFVMFFAALVLVWQQVPAQAFINAPEPYTSTSYEPQLVSEFEGGSYDGVTVNANQLTLFPPSGAPPVWYNADLITGAENAGRIPLVAKSLTLASKAILLGTAFDVGWKIGRTIDNEWLHLEGQTPSPVINATVNAMAFCTAGAGWANTTPCGNGIGAGISGYVHDGRDTVLNTYTTGTNDCHGGGPWYSADGIYFNPSGFNVSSASTCERNIVTALTNEATATGAYSGALSGWATSECTGGFGFGLCQVVPDSSTVCNAEINAWLNTRGDGSATYANPNQCWSVELPEKGMLEALAPTPIQKFTTQTAPSVVTTTMSPAPSAYCDSACAQTMRCAIDATCPGSGASPASSDQADCYLDPADYNCPANDQDHVPGGHKKSTASPTWVPVVVPTPLPGETVQQYLDRLHALNWIGVITIADSALEGTAATGSSYALAPDGTITGVTVGTVPEATPYLSDGSDPVGWPLTMPTLTTADVPITLDVKPTPSVFDVPVATPSAGCPCTVRPVDFTPLTSLSFGDHFPFGFPGYIGGIFDAVNITPVAPSWTFDVPFSSSFGGVQHWTIDWGTILGSGTDTYMSWYRTIFSWVLWIGTVFIVGRRFIFGNRAEVGGAMPEDDDD